MRWSKEELDNYLIRQLPHKNQDTEPDEGPEQKLQSRIEDYLKENGFYFFHDRSRGENKAGQPDLVIALHGGRTLWIELKQAKGRMSKDQIRTSQKLLALSHEFYEIRSFKTFLEILKKEVGQ